MNTQNIYIKYGKIGSDETARYYITLAKPMTVGEFITEWLTTGEWGYFGIYKPGAIFGDPQCGYKQGKIIGKGLPEEYLNKPIKNVYGSGGWSRSDFEFEVEDRSPEIEKAYERGLNDAWECARRIYVDNTMALNIEIFGGDTGYLGDVIRNYSASEAIAKIKAYEKQIEADGRVTDESIIRTHLEDVVESGFSLDEIANVLEKMRNAK